jgi:tight adherence protein C
MSTAVLLAALAGLFLAAGLGDLATLVAERRRAAARPGSSRAARAAALLTHLGRRIGVPSPPGDLSARLAAAGLAHRLTAADAMAIKAGGGAAAALATAPVAVGLPLRLALVVLPVTALAGFLALDLHLLRRARHRAQQARIELADVLDLLRVAVASGLPTGRALAEVGRHRRGLVAAELRALADNLALGVPRAAALAELRRRLPPPALATLVAAIDRADRHGTPLAPALTALAAEARADRARALHDQAARASPRIQLAIALLLVPSVLLLVAAGLVHGLA